MENPEREEQAMKLIYTYTDEAPALATHSLLPIIEAFVAPAGVSVETRDISLTHRILAAWSDKLPEEQRVNDALAELGELAKTPEANIIKLPNISASLSQLKQALKELQDDGYELPDYPEEPSRSTGLTLLPLAVSYRSFASRSASLEGSSG